MEAAIAGKGDPHKVVKYFEVLKEKAPELVLPFDRIAAVGRAYRAIGESERAYLVWRAVAEASYLEDARIGEALRQRGYHAVAGDASDPAVLIQAHVARARMLVIAIPDTFHVRKMIEIARTLNPDIETVVRTHSEEEAGLLRAENAGTVFLGEHELAIAMTRHVMDKINSQRDLDLRVESPAPSGAGERANA